MTQYEQFVVGLSAITALVTIVGWWKTSSDQRKLLDRQIAADAAKAKLALHAPRRTEQLDQVKQWVADTERLRRRLGQSPFEQTQRSEFVTDFQKWEQAYFIDIRPLAPVLDSELESLLGRFFNAENYSMLMIFNGQPPPLQNPFWHVQRDEVRTALRAKLTELEKTIFEN